MDTVFRSYCLDHGRLADWRENPFPTTFSAWSHGDLPLDNGATHFGFAAEGYGMLRTSWATFPLAPGMYFSLPGDGSVGGEGTGIVISRGHHKAFFHLGGPIEPQGRLRYIDGCSDSLLIPPIVQGDPCLNLLYIPPAVDQTPHTHPSHRLGLVVRGTGLCRTPNQTIPLKPGLAWMIEANALHSFHTTKSSLTIIAYHPDSDFGPTDDNHPMLNRTLVDETSSELEPGQHPTNSEDAT